MRDSKSLRLAVVEMKSGFSLELLLQAVDRMRVADEVWLAVPASRRGRDRDRRVHRLCRLIGFGLVAVDAAHDRVEVLAEPGPYRPRAGCEPARAVAYRAYAALWRSIARRFDAPARDDGLPSAGAGLRLLIARRSPRPRDLRVVAPDSSAILLRNVYGWFERAERGLYRLTSLGEAALQRWPGEVSPTSATHRDSSPPTPKAGRVGDIQI